MSRKKKPRNLNSSRRELVPRARPGELGVEHPSIEEVYGWGAPGTRPELTRTMRNQNLGDGSWQAWVNDPIGITGNVDPTFGTSRRLPRAGELVARALAEEKRLLELRAPQNADIEPPY